MYTINNFLDIKKEIYEYCSNLTITRNNGVLVRHKDRADDLFQEVYLRSYEYLPTNRNKIVSKEMYIQIIRNITFWVHAARYNQKLKGNKLLCNLNYYQDSPVSEHNIQEKLQEEPKVFEELINNPDFKLYTRNLSIKELQILEYSIKGYDMIETINKFNIDNNMFYLVFEKVSLAAIKHKSVKTLDLVEFKRRVINSNKYIKIRNKEIIYHLYSNGDKYREISEKMNLPIYTVRDIIFLFNKKNKLRSVGGREEKNLSLCRT